jgi:radical SAM protein with 4Fe4S-binding SPASM domain
MTLSRPSVSFLPVTAVLEMTYRCNHACLFCSCPWMGSGRTATPPELSTREWKEVLDLLSRHGVHNICFTGGEALLRPDLEELIAYASRLKITMLKEKNGHLTEEISPPKLYLLSNGRLVNGKVLDMCQRHGIQLSISMPGLRTYKELTAGGDVRKVVRAFQGAKERGLKTVVGITVTKKNLSELYETIAAAFLAGATQLLLNRFLEGGRGRSFARELTLDREELIAMLDTAELALHHAGRYGSVGTELPLCLFDPARYTRLEVSTGCSAAKGFFVIGPSGRIRGCNHSPVELAHYAQIDTLKKDPYWMRLTQNDYLPGMCSGCHDAGRCAGGCREAAQIISGALDAPDALFTTPEFAGNGGRP